MLIVIMQNVVMLMLFKVKSQDKLTDITNTLAYCSKVWNIYSIGPSSSQAQPDQGPIS
jgi:hypothetical protein